MRIILFMADLHLDGCPSGIPFLIIGIWALINPIIENIDEIVNYFLERIRLRITLMLQIKLPIHHIWPALTQTFG